MKLVEKGLIAKRPSGPTKYVGRLFRQSVSKWTCYTHLNFMARISMFVTISMVRASVPASEFGTSQSLHSIISGAWIDLPSVNDLDVAAAAAAADLEVMAPPMPRAVIHHPVAFNRVEPQRLIYLRLSVIGDHVMPVLEVAAEEDTSSSDESMDDSDEEESIHDLEEIRDMINKAMNEEDDDYGARAPSAVHDLGLPDQPLSMEGVMVTTDEAIEPAGSVLSVFDGMVVVQGLESQRALDESSVLCLEDRSLIGRIEEVFGPITQPLYALRWSGTTGAPVSLQSGARIFSVPRLCGFIPLDEIRSTKDKPVHGEALDVNEGDDEVYFSDDEQEAEFLKVSSKRKVPDIAQPQSDPRHQGKGRGIPGSSKGAFAGRGVSHRSGHNMSVQSQPSNHFRAMATASQMQAVAISTSNSGGGRGGGARQGSVMSAQYASINAPSHLQGQFQQFSTHEPFPPPSVCVQGQQGAPFPFAPTGYGSAPPNLPLQPPPQYPKQQPPFNQQYPSFGR